VTMACTLSDPDTLLGWIAFHRPTSHLHYVYVRDNMRRRGVASELIRVTFGEKSFTFRSATERFKKFLAPKFNCKER
jgi:GNAT superfamily N-acetyltransferase